MKQILNILVFLILTLIGLQVLTERFVFENESISIEIKIEIEKEEKEKEDKDEYIDVLQKNSSSIKQSSEYQNYLSLNYQNPSFVVLTTPPEFTT